MDRYTLYLVRDARHIANCVKEFEVLPPDTTVAVVARVLHDLAEKVVAQDKQIKELREE